ncbi:precorrin-3B C(17)-methyltransferase [Malaciobacter mytili]|uniref:Precorrin-3B C(17)-methyltransferase n=1 Tax=Malaciobacter mytili LMG 24559 TaxID=1032238 RepID=A0AAX2AHM2_9BACT|nr:precorrin-3B C(17)-methyltransferase [Malaciobacter mytili]AXH15136.1 cobalt-precorrin-3 (C17)-methyltransferase [Malaciobacter mytili LMG 24559]RXI44381.1 precorrin-3B C(17)-methyltransferase [Malaciobacter mytili]RXK15645.1 precorrin-3B C(17)-methyltransferase [Malaciobacter mytili LMG 24559]
MAKRLYIVSSGAGGTSYITPEAKKAIENSEVIVAYSKYARELKELIEGKEIFTSGMTHEIERCNQAIQYAKEGKTTSIISNGDTNVYGMATLIVEIMDEKNLWDEIELISLPGVTSFLAAASKVGAPVSQDFAIISLSDRLTDINLIDKRVKAALDCDFIMGIYNPKSKKRIKPYENFLKALENGYENRIAIIATHVGREEKEKITITTAQDLITQGIEHEAVCMSTLIIICNSNTKLTKNGLVLTPRGYLNKYDLQGEIKA